MTGDSDAALPRVLVVVGTRPEAIKLAPVADALRARADVVETRVVLTGQHTTLVSQALETFDLRPDHDLGIMRDDQSLYEIAAGCLQGLRRVAAEERPDAVLVQGDTATACFGALAGFFEGVVVGHVEAGLRSGNPRIPFPEEMFRRVADQVADLRFAPTRQAAANLRREGFPDASVFVTGNTVVDALIRIARSARRPTDPELARVLDDGRRLVLLTAHRRESFGEPLESIFRGVRRLADRREDIVVLYPVHPNPNVRAPAHDLLGGHPRVRLVEPLDYPDLVLALREAALVLTDSGGIQEEAPTFGTPVIVLREVTERPEAVEVGAAQIVGTDGERMLARALAILDAPGGRTGAPNPFGDGQAGERIADIVVSRLTGSPRTIADWVGPSSSDPTPPGG